MLVPLPEEERRALSGRPAPIPAATDWSHYSSCEKNNYSSNAFYPLYPGMLRSPSVITG